MPKETNEVTAHILRHLLTDRWIGIAFIVEPTLSQEQFKELQNRTGKERPRMHLEVKHHLPRQVLALHPTGLRTELSDKQIDDLISRIFAGYNVYRLKRKIALGTLGGSNERRGLAALFDQFRKKR